MKKRSEELINAGNLLIDTHKIARNDIITAYSDKIKINILDHGYFWGDLNWNRFEVISPYSRLYFVRRYMGWLETPDGEVMLTPGKMYLVPPYYKVNLRTDDKIEKFYYHFTTHFDGIEIFEDLNKCLELMMPENYFERYAEAFESNEISQLLIFKSLVYETVSMFIKEFLPDIKDKLLLASKYKEIYDYIDKNLSILLSAKNICEVMDLSYISITRNYKKDTGITLNNYIRSRIVYKAIDLLLHSSLSVKSIAEELGFIDEFYFSRFFKKQMEYSPREYRRINKR